MSFQVFYCWQWLLHQNWDILLQSTRVSQRLVISNVSKISKNCGLKTAGHRICCGLYWGFKILAISNIDHILASVIDKSKNIKYFLLVCEVLGETKGDMYLGTLNGT